MTIGFPTTLDNFTNPTPADNLNTPTVLHSTQHANLNDAVEALEAKVGVTGSLVTTSLDYKVTQLEASAHVVVTLGTANGLALNGQQLSLGAASGAAAGALSAADWTTFNNKQAALTFPLAANLGGTGIANAAESTLTLGAATTISGGGTLALGGYTLTVPATGTPALLATANVFTTNQKVNTNSTSALLVEQTGVKNNVLVVDTTNARVGINVVPTVMYDIAGTGNEVIHQLTVQSDTATDAINYILRRASVGPANIGAGHDIAQWDWQGYASNAYRTVARLLVEAESAPTGTLVPGRLVWYVTSASASLVQFQRVASTGKIRFGKTLSAPAARIHIEDDTTTANAVNEVLRVETVVSTTSTGASNGFGSGIGLYAETGTDGTNQKQAYLYSSWVDATNASRKARVVLSAYDTAEREGLRIEASGTAATIGFLGAAAIARQAHIVDADGSLSDITSKFNTLLSYFENFGLIATS